MIIEKSLAKLDGICCRIEDLVTALQLAVEKRPSPYAKLRETFPNAGKPWSKNDDDQLKRLFTGSNSIADLTQLFGRTEKGVRVRLERLGIAG